MTRLSRISFFLLWAAWILGPQNGYSQFTQQLGPNYYLVGLNSNAFDVMSTTAYQHQNNWCWAACVEQALAYCGVQVSQEQVVERCFGDLYDLPGGPAEMFAALNGWAPNTRGGYSYIRTNNYPITGTDLYNMLTRNWPLIACLNQAGSNIGHAYVLTGMYYHYTNWGGIFVDRVVLRNPWPENGSNRTEMSIREFQYRVNTVYRVWVE